MHQEPDSKKPRKPTRREQLNEWKQNQATKKPDNKPKSTSVKPIRFEDMLRNDSVSLVKRSTSNQPSKSKGSKLGTSSTSTNVRQTASEKEDQERAPREKVNVKLDLNIGKGVFSYTESMGSSKIFQDFSPSDLKIDAHHSSDGSFMVEEEEKARKSNESQAGSQEPGDQMPMSMWKSYDLTESAVKEASNTIFEENIVEKQPKVETSEENDGSEMEITALGDQPDPKQRDLREFLKPSNQPSNQNSGNKDQKGNGDKLEVEEKDVNKKRSTSKSPVVKSSKKGKSANKDALEVEKSPAKTSKKRKARDEQGDKEEGILAERESLKKVLLNDSKSKEDSAKVKIDVGGSSARNRSSGRKKTVVIVKKKEEKPEQAQTGSAVEKYGSGMKYSMIEKKSKNGVERIMTPVRTSKRFSSISKSPPNSKGRSKGKSNNDSNTCSKMSVTFAEDHDVSYIHNNLGEIFEPVDEESTKIREMIKKRRPTPYSKSTKKPESDEEDEEMRDELSMALLSSGKKSAQSKGKTPGKIDVKKILDPNVRGNGNYALLELKESSAKKFGTRKVITPLKDITHDKVVEAKEDVKFLVGENGEDIGYVPRTVEVAKKLESFY